MDKFSPAVFQLQKLTLSEGASEQLIMLLQTVPSGHLFDQSSIFQSTTSAAFPN